MVLKMRWLLPGCLSIFLLAPTAKADTLAFWHFAADQKRLPTPPQMLAGNYLFFEEEAPPVERATGINPTNAGTTLGAKMTLPQQQIASLMTRYKFLHSGMFFLDLDTGNYLDINGDRVFPAASTIKLPILIAFFQDLDAGKVRLDENLVMRPDLKARGSGTMQYRAAWTKFSALETVTKMITISDNTATNMIIDRLGGAARLNQRFLSWGLRHTRIRHLLGDFSGTNTTSPKDLVQLLALLVGQKLVSLNSQEQVLDLLHRTTVHTLLPAGLGKGAVIANKTGDIGFLIGDAGVITLPNGKRYLAGIFVRRPYDDPRGRDFIRQVSRLMYNYLDQPLPVYPVAAPPGGAVGGSRTDKS